MGPAGLLAGLGGASCFHCADCRYTHSGSAAQQSDRLLRLCDWHVQRTDFHLLEKGREALLAPEKINAALTEQRPPGGLRSVATVSNVWKK